MFTRWADAFRSLYLNLVKKYHPDLALSEQDKKQRHEMMIAINDAYKDTDAGTLQEIAETGKLPPPKRVRMPFGGSPGRGPGRRDDGGPRCPNCGSSDTERPQGGFTINPNSWMCRKCFHVFQPMSGGGGGGRQREQGSSDQKTQMLRRWRRYLGQVAKNLGSYGYTEQNIRTNPGGPAVSGEVYGYFYAPGKDFGVFVQVGERSYARWTAREERGKHTQTGPNQLFNIRVGEGFQSPSAQSLAQHLRDIAEKQNSERKSEY